MLVRHLARALLLPPLALLPLVGCFERGESRAGGDSDVDSDADVDTDSDADTDTDTDTSTIVCAPVPPPEALVRSGAQQDGSVLDAVGRATRSVGEAIPLERGGPTTLAVHPGGRFAYVLASRHTDDVVVLDIEQQQAIQRFDPGNLVNGLALSPDGARAYVAAGSDGKLIAYDVGADGTLTEAARVEIGGRLSAVAVSPDGARAWVGKYEGSQLVEVDLATMTVSRTIYLQGQVWDLIHLASRDELVASDLGNDSLAFVDLAEGKQSARLRIANSLAGMAASDDEATLWVTVASTDEVVAVDTASRTVTARVKLTEGDRYDDSDRVLPLVNANAIAQRNGRLYVSRGVDSVVSVLDAATLEGLGAFPVGRYPADLAFAPDGQLLVAEMKAVPTVDNRLNGAVSRVDVSALDLAATTAEAKALYRRGVEAFPYDCAGFFPIPTRPGQTSPIEYVFLVVKENQTFDRVFGELDNPEIEADPEMLGWGETITPNHYQLAREFNIADNFVLESFDSDLGHIALTTVTTTEYAERMWENLDLGWQVGDAVTAAPGNFFTHAHDHGRSVRIYGEIVGQFETAQDGTVMFNRSDQMYPGGPAINYQALDEDKAEYIVERVQAGDISNFTYISLPNDHTQGTKDGFPTPESMMADNDVGLGKLVEGITHSEIWDRSAIFVLQDDPQGWGDHVDDKRSFLMVISPWARRGGYVSHVASSFDNVYATIERLLDLPPMTRESAMAAPLWDLFQPEPDLTPYTHLPREYPSEMNTKKSFGAALSAQLDLRGADRDPRLYPLIQAYRGWRMGKLTRAEAEARISGDHIDAETWEAWREEAEEEATAFDWAMEKLRRYMANHDLVRLPTGEVVPADSAEARAGVRLR